MYTQGMTVAVKQVVVTGSDGFLGKRLVALLESHGLVVRGFDFTKGEDILNTSQVEDAIRNSQATAVIHLAAVADLNVVAKDVQQGWKINVEGTRSVLAACKATGARLLFASTCCAYGNNKCHPSSETSPLCPAEEYLYSGSSFVISFLLSFFLHFSCFFISFLHKTAE